MTRAGSGSRREALVVLGLAVVATGFLVLASGRPWATAVLAVPGLPRTEQMVTGQELVPAAFGLGLAGLAGTLGVLATRGVARRIASAVLALCGVGAAVAAGLATGADSVADALPATFGAAGVQVHMTAWPVLAVGAGVLAAACGVVAAWRGPRWPGMGSRYDAPKQQDTEPDMWRSLDRGDDPTL